jgi:CelD/BcsL family acetyltransferase involved in cellulose biosynthesis
MPRSRWITLEELTDRRAEWHELASTSEFPSAFADPAWILAWWRSYGEDHDPWLFALEDREGSLRGLAPLALRRSSFARALIFAGGAWNGLETLLCSPGAEAELSGSLLEALAERRREWDVWRVQRLRMDSALVRTLLDGEGTLRAAAHDVRLQPLIELPADADTFESRFPGKRRNEFRRRWRKLLDLGAQARLITDPAEVQAKVAAILEMRRSWAVANGQSHAHLDARFERFINEVIRDFSPDGVRLWSLELDGKILTAKLNFVEGSREHGYLSGLSDEQLSLSPGHALERHVILAMIAEGRREFDFGPGRDTYKYRWGAVDQELARMAVVSPSPRGRLLGTSAAIDLRLRNTAAAEALRRRRGVMSERATAQLPMQETPQA